MGAVKKIRTVCRSCHGGCGVIAHVQDNKVIKVEGDPASPISHGTMCSKGLAITQLAYHPDRIRHPMKKTRKGWDRITWDDALDTVAEKFKSVIDTSGPESIVVGQGTGRDYESHLYRFANLLGTPNVLTAGHMCYVSRVGATLITCGNLPVADWHGHPRCIVMWGCNPQWTNPDEHKGVDFWSAYKKGAKLIVIDPRKGFLAKKADLWLQIRPGTDGALAMGFMNVIISEDLYEKDFVNHHVHGWDAFVERVKEYPLEAVESITWIPKDLIRKAARMYAKTKPAILQWGVPTEQTINCTDCTRALVGLMAATGNLDTPGGNVFFVPPKVRSVSAFSCHKDLSAGTAQKTAGRRTIQAGCTGGPDQPESGLGRHSDRKTLSPESRTALRHQSGSDPGQCTGSIRRIEEIGFSGGDGFLSHPHSRSGRHLSASRDLARTEPCRRQLEAPRLRTGSGESRRYR